MTYAYFCPTCGAEQDDWHNISEDPEVKCKACDSIMKHKITGGTATHLKGFGWTTSGSKDGTQGHHKPVTQTEMAVPVNANDVVSKDAIKGADSVRIAKQI